MESLYLYNQKGHFFGKVIKRGDINKKEISNYLFPF